MKLYRVSSIPKFQYPEFLVKAENFGDAMKFSVELSHEVTGELTERFEIEVICKDVDTIPTIVGE